MYEIASLNGMKGKMLTSITLEMSGVSTDKSEKNYTSTVLWLIMLFPPAAWLNNSETTVHIYWD